MNIYICNVCGHIEFDSAPENCPSCGAPKNQFTQNDNIFKESAEKSPEADVKHIPKIQVEKNCQLIPEEGCTDVYIRIGETIHPMEEKHFIQFADCYLDRKFVERVQFTPNSVFPAACIHLKESSGTVTIVENCNIHGYWMSEISI